MPEAGELEEVAKNLFEDILEFKQESKESNNIKGSINQPNINLTKIKLNTFAPQINKVPKVGKIKVNLAPIKMNIAPPSNIKPPTIGLRDSITSNSSSTELAQKLEKFERYYGKKFTKDTPIYVLKKAI